ncbi:MAG TPA: nucleotidyltransferase family protein [Candidatus Latescibacteria bacterium]|nr:nucleotidyltransferase family protein [Candidatus Latescibacterota bacterium]
MSECAVLLAAGPGTRLRPLTDTIPKCLVPVGGRPMLDWWLELLARHGVDRALVATNYLSDQVKAFVRRQKHAVEVEVRDEPVLLGTAGAVTAQAEWLEKEESFWVIYVDNLSSADLSAMRSFHREKKGIGTLGVYETPVPSQCGIVELKNGEEANGSGQVLRLVEKPAFPAGNLANGGLYLLDREILDHIPAPPCDFARDVFPAILAQPSSRPLFAWRIRGYHLDMGTLETYQRAEQDVRNGVFP